MKGRVYKRGKTWYYRFDIEPGPLTGKRRQVNGSRYATDREAWKACRAAISDHEIGLAVSSERRKLAELILGGALATSEATASAAARRPAAPAATTRPGEA